MNKFNYICITALFPLYENILMLPHFLNLNLLSHCEYLEVYVLVVENIHI